MTAKMTIVFYRRGCMNALICVIGVLGVIGILTFGISAMTGRTLRDSGEIALAASWIVTFVTFILTLWISRRKRGVILLDCGHHPGRALFLLNAVLFAVIGLRGAFASSTLDTLVSASALFGVTSSIFFALVSFGRLQILENGIWMYWGLLKWQKLESYKWQGDTNPTLVLQVKTRIHFLGRGALPVSAEHKKTVSKLLDQYADHNVA